MKERQERHESFHWEFDRFGYLNIRPRNLALRRCVEQYLYSIGADPGDAVVFLQDAADSQAVIDSHLSCEEAQELDRDRWIDVEMQVHTYLHLVGYDAADSLECH